MALILNTTTSYADEFGNIHDNPYLVIDSVIINKLSNFVKIYVNIYKNKESRINGLKPLFEKVYPIVDIDEYNKYFSTSTSENVNIFQKSYTYIQSNFYSDWKSDQ